MNSKQRSAALSLCLLVAQSTIGQTAVSGGNSYAKFNKPNEIERVTRYILKDRRFRRVKLAILQEIKEEGIASLRESGLELDSRQRRTALEEYRKIAERVYLPRVLSANNMAHGFAIYHRGARVKVGDIEKRVTVPFINIYQGEGRKIHIDTLPGSKGLTNRFWDYKLPKTLQVELGSKAFKEAREIVIQLRRDYGE
ncbi:MAG: hypothetical protein ACE5FT_03875 [Candidatus Nanoarchaeia archaeon]